MAGIEIAVIAIAAVLALLVVFIARERKARSRFRILGEVATVSDAGGSLEQTFEAICDILVPELADFCMIDVIEDGVPRRVAVRVSPGAEPEFERGLAERMPSTPEHMVGPAGGGSLRPRFFERIGEPELREIAHDDGEDLEFLRRLRMRSAITVALQARGEVTGTLTLGVAWSRRRYRREDARFARILSGHLALALDNSGLFADLEDAERSRAEIAETLQRGLLPSPLPHIPGWSVAAMYRPAGAENEVGGDFYDVFRLPRGWMLVIGDVTGRGAHAASVTAVARYTLRTAAILTDDPLVALRTLNRALLARGDAALCSLAALTLSEDRFEPVRVAVAGHPPPLLIDGERVAEVSGGDSNPVLGAFEDAEWTIARSELGAGQHLVLVTDGITEAQGPRGRFGEERLRAELGGSGGPAGVVQGLEASLHSFTDGRLVDDMAIVAISRTATDVPAELPADGSEGLVQRLYECFNRRDEECMTELCAEQMEFFPVVTAEAVGREAPYRGRAGLRDYLADIAEVWEELRISPHQIERDGDRLLVHGRVYARSREHGIRDVPVAWIWTLRDGRFVRGEVFPDPARAPARFGAAPQASAG